MWVRLVFGYSGTVACVLVFLAIRDMPRPAVASGLKQEHTLFGKCTQSDVDFASLGANPEFLASEGIDQTSVSPNECQKQAMELESIWPTIEEVKEEDPKDEFTKRLGHDSSESQIIGRLKYLLRDDTEAADVQRRGILKKMGSSLKIASHESTIFVLGLGPELLSLEKMAKNVIAVEGSRTACLEFLKSAAGACSLQSNFHIYCMKQDTEPDRASEKNESDGGVVTQQYVDLLKDLINHQYGDVPISAAVIMGPFAMAKLMAILPYVDPSTAIIFRSRVTAPSLRVLNEYFSIRWNQYPNDPLANPRSTERLMMLQRRYGTAVEGNLWKTYTNDSWGLAENHTAYDLLDKLIKLGNNLASSDGLSSEEKESLVSYFRTYARMLRVADDSELNDLLVPLTKMQSMFQKGVNAGTILKFAKTVADKYALKSSASSELKRYVDLLKTTAKKQEPGTRGLADAMVTEFLLEAAYYASTTEMMDAVQDGIEDICELAKSNPDKFLPAIHLLRKGMACEDCIREIRTVLGELGKVPNSVWRSET